MNQKPLILVIEDSPSMREQMVRILDQSGYRTCQASSAIEAVGVARQQIPDLILTDIVLPGMDGATTASLLRDVEGFTNLPVILVSALSSEDLRQKKEDMGATDFLTKPFTPDELTRSVRRCLNPA
jgi:CheY-like chemotaxis protein